MKVTINETMFETMLKAVKNGVSKYDARPFLHFIRLKIESGKITATVCDGYSGARFKFDARDHDGEDFACVIKPIPFKASKSGAMPVVIELIDKEAICEVPTEYGYLTYHFKQNCEWDTNLDVIFDKMKEHDREVGINAALMSRIMRSFESVTTSKNRLVVLESKSNPREGFCLHTENDHFEFEQFLLPMRMDK